MFLCRGRRRRRRRRRRNRRWRSGGGEGSGWGFGGRIDRIVAASTSLQIHIVVRFLFLEVFLLALFVLAISSSSSLIFFFVLFFGGFFNLFGSVAIGRVCQFWDFLFAGAKERGGGVGGGVEELWW